MPQYWLLFSYPTTLTERRQSDGGDIDALNDEIVAAGIGVLVCSLHQASEAKSLRAQSSGKVLGVPEEKGAHVRSWDNRSASLDEAVEWARKASSPVVWLKSPSLAARRQLNGMQEGAGWGGPVTDRIFPIFREPKLSSVGERRPK